MKSLVLSLCLTLLASVAYAQIPIVGPGHGGAGGGGSTGSLTCPAGSNCNVAQYNVNGEINVKSPPYAAAGVNTTFSATVVNSTHITLNAAYDGPVNSYVSLAGVGTNQSFSAPSAPSATVGTQYCEVETFSSGTISTTHVAAADVSVTDYANGWPYQPVASVPTNKQYTFSAGTFASNASVNSTVVLCYVTTASQAGASHNYAFVAADDNGGYSPVGSNQAETIGTQASPILDLSNLPGNGTIATGVNSVALAVPALPSHATKWIVCKDNAIYDLVAPIWLEGTPANAPVQPNNWVDQGQNINGLTSQGIQTDLANACLAGNSAGSPDHLVTQVVGGAATTALTIGSAIISSPPGSVTMRHDDTNAFQTGCNASLPSGTGPALHPMLVPAGTYRISSSLVCGPSSGQASGWNLYGQGQLATIITWDGPENATVLRLQNVERARVTDIEITGGPSMADLEMSGTGGANLTNNKLDRLTCGNNSHFCFRGENPNDLGAVSEMEIFASSAGGSNRNWVGYEAGEANDTNWTFYDSGCDHLGPEGFSATAWEPLSNVTCISANGLADWSGGSNTSGNAINWYNGSVSKDPAGHIPCTACGLFQIGGGGPYTIQGVNNETSGTLVQITGGSTATQINLINNIWQGLTLPNGHELITNRGTGTSINSIGNTWISPLVIDSTGPFFSMGDGYATTGHATVAGYFKQVLGVATQITVMQNGVSLGGIGKTTWSGTSASVGASTTDYLTFGENAGQSVISTEANAQVVASYAGTASNLFCFATTSAGASGDVYFLRDTATNTVLTCTILNGANTCSDTAHAAPIARGDLLDISVGGGSNSNATGVTSCSFILNG